MRQALIVFASMSLIGCSATEGNATVRLRGTPSHWASQGCAGSS